MLAAIPFINEDFFNWTLIGALLVNGLKNGSIYALMALTVVIIYKTTGHLNFAQGEMGTLGAFIVFVLAIEHGWSYWLAIPAALVFSFLLGAALERTLVRPDRAPQRPGRGDRHARHLPGHQRPRRGHLGHPAGHAAGARAQRSPTTSGCWPTARPGWPSATAPSPSG